jgi:hypothetical protein
MGATYPGWFKVVAGGFELVAVALMYIDRPLALLASSIFLGGVAQVQTLPNGPLAKSGVKALIPVSICSAATVYLLFNSSRGVPLKGFDGTASAILGSTPSIFVFLGGVAAGFVAGVALKAMNAGTSPE